MEHQGSRVSPETQVVKGSRDPQVRQGWTPTGSGADCVGRGCPSSLVLGHLETVTSCLMTALFFGWEI